MRLRALIECGRPAAGLMASSRFVTCKAPEEVAFQVTVSGGEEANAGAHAGDRSGANTDVDD